MGYENAAQFDRAAKRSIKNTGKDPGIAYREMLRDRFLCRVFSEDDPRFLLKGGSGMLARIPDARYERHRFRCPKSMPVSRRRLRSRRGSSTGIVQSGSRQCLMEPRKYRMGFLSVIYHSGQDTPLYLLALSAASKMRSALAKMRASSPTVMS